MNDTCLNTDKEIWRERPGDFYADSIHVTESGAIGMNCGGHVIVAPIRKWHKAGKLIFCVNPNLSSWRRKLGMWLLKTNQINQLLSTGTITDDDLKIG